MKKIQLMLAVLMTILIVSTACDKSTSTSPAPNASQSGADNPTEKDTQEDKPHESTLDVLETEPHTHNYEGSWTVYIEPTCTQVGF